METRGGAMRLRGADYSSELHNSSNPTLDNVTVTNCCRGIRIQDSIGAYVKDCDVSNVSDNAIYFAAGSYGDTLANDDGCRNCTADNCTVTTAGQVAFLSIGGGDNKFTNCSMNGSRGAGVGVYNTNGLIEVINCNFTNANTAETVTPWGANTDDFGGGACGMSVKETDTNGIVIASGCTFISGDGSVYWKTPHGVMQAIQNTVMLANFPDSLVQPSSAPIDIIPPFTYTQNNSLGAETGVITIYGINTDSLENLLAESEVVRAQNQWPVVSNLKIVGNGAGAIWQDFKYKYDLSASLLGGSVKPNKLHIENISLVTSTIDDYAVYSKTPTLTPMKDVTISG